MAVVHVEWPAFLSREAGKVGKGWVAIDEEVAAGTTVIALLSLIAATDSGFRESVFNPDVGTVNEQVSVILNDTLLSFDEIWHTPLADRDAVKLLPIYSGG